MDVSRSESVMSLLSDMERDLNPEVPQVLNDHASFTRRMAVQSTLTGHIGCVNRLAFSEDASLLLSGSDDSSLRLWHVDASTNVRHAGRVTPGHTANIFGVAFMPHTGNAYVISAGHDEHVHHTHVETSRGTLWRDHDNEVRTVAPLDRFTFVSASRDGTARVFDARLSSSVPPTVVVRVHRRFHIASALNSAIPSPVCSHHLLVGGSDAAMRVFDLRYVPPAHVAANAAAAHGGSTGHAHCIEEYTPRHLHPCAPEQINRRNEGFAMSTYATFSPDGKQIVASYLNDAVVVFDRPQHSRALLCRPPKLSSAMRAASIARFSGEAMRKLHAQEYSAAISSSNKALELDECNMFAWVCKAAALIERERPGDFRSAYGNLQLIVDTIRKDGRSVIGLWGLTECWTNEDRAWKDKADIWLAIFQYLQTFSMYRLIGPLYFTMLLNPKSSERILTMQRLEHLSNLCRKLDDYREQTWGNLNANTKERDGWDVYVKRRALGSKKEMSVLYGPDGTYRKRVLTSLALKFASGIGRLRDRLRDSLQCLQPEAVAKDFLCSHAGDSGWDEDQLELARRIIVESRADDDDDQNDNLEEYYYHLHRGGYDARQPARDGLNVGMTKKAASEGTGADLWEMDAVWNLWGPLKQENNYRSFHDHRSRRTDIKEANFYGSKNQYILSGSDDGHVYIWSASTAALIARVHADEQIVNCVLPHPEHTMIMASGIDDTIKVLAPIS